MDPFVPEPEERLAYQETATAKARPRGGDQPPPTENSLWPGGLREHAKLIIPFAVILTLMLAQYGIQNRNINYLEEEVASLKTLKATAVTAEDSTDPLPELQKELSEQADLIRTLEQRIATQIIDLDSLRENLSGQSGGTADGGVPRAELDQIRKNLQALETRLTTLNGQTDNALARINTQDKQVSDWQTSLQNQLVEAGKSQSDQIDSQEAVIQKLQGAIKNQRGAQQKLRNDVIQMLAGMDTKLGDGLGKTLAEVDTKMAAVTSRINGVQTEQNAALDTQQQRLAEMEKSLAGVDSKIESELANSQVELGKTLSKLETRIAEVAREMGSLQDQQKTALATQAKTLQTQLVSQFDSRLETVSKQADAVTALEEKITRQMTDVNNTLAGTRQQLAALEKTVDLTAAANGNSGKAVAATRQALADIESKLASMSGEMDSAIAKLDRQKAAIDEQLKEQQSFINGSATNPFADQIASQIDARIKPQEETLNQQVGLIKSLEEQLTAQLADIDGLRGNGAKLNDEIVATREALEQARQNLDGQTSQVKPEQLDAFLTAVKLEVTGLNRDIEGAVAKIGQQEAQLDHWRGEIENRINSATSHNASTSSDENIDRLQDQLAAQLEAMEKLRVSNAQMEVEVFSTRQQLDALRQAIDNPANRSSGGAAEVDLLAMQARMDDLNGNLENSVSRLRQQEKTFNEWQRELESRVAASEKVIATNSGGASDGVIDPVELRYIKVTLAALKKQHPFVKFPAE